MNTLQNNFDTIEKLIFEEGVRIKTIYIHPELDLMLVILNTKAVLHISLSSYPTLEKVKKEVFLKYELIADGVGIHLHHYVCLYYDHILPFGSCYLQSTCL